LSEPGIKENGLRATILRGKEPGRKRAHNHRRIAALVILGLLATIGLLFWSSRLKPVPDFRSIAAEERPNGSSLQLAGQTVPILAASSAGTRLSADGQIAKSVHRSEGFLIAGRVVSSDGLPIDDATVSLCKSINPATWICEQPIAVALTDGMGSYEIELDAPPKGPLYAAKGGYEAQVSILMRQDSGMMRKDFVLARASATVRGRVTDTTGNPIPAIAICASSPKQILFSQNDTIHNLPQVVITDSKGRFTLTQLTAGRWHIGIDDHYYQGSRTFEIGDGQSQTVDLICRTVARVKVIDSAGYPVYASISRADGVPWDRGPGRDSSGYFTIPIDPESGTQSLKCNIAADGFFPRTVDIYPRQEKKVVLEKDVLLSGIVVSAEGQPIQGARVIIDPGGTFPNAALTDDTGFFTLPRIERSPTRIWAIKPGYAEQKIPVDSKNMPGFMRIILSPVASASNNASEQAKDDSGSIFGRIVDSSGKPGLVFKIFVVPHHENMVGWKAVNFVSAEGEFRIGDLPEGAYSITVQKQDESNPNMERSQMIEIRKGGILGPIVLQLQEPDKR
jgi:hypothetical protein